MSWKLTTGMPNAFCPHCGTITYICFHEKTKYAYCSKDICPIKIKESDNAEDTED